MLWPGPDEDEGERIGEILHAFSQRQSWSTTAHHFLVDVLEAP